MHVVRLVLGPLSTNCWIVSKGPEDPAIVIDPADELPRILEALGERPVTTVVLTHCHFDHIAAAEGLVEATGAPLLAHRLDAPFVTDPVGTGAALFAMDGTAPRPDRELEDGDVVEGDGFQLEVVHTPGHTPGSISLLGEEHLFSGDLVFAGSVGRTDFPRGDARELKRSIVERVSPLADEVAVHPGHGPDTTVGRERLVNPFFPRA
jgi:glyoxylase-like metal-dependent hydrolase (beta-lactamase superfamily II)